MAERPGAAPEQPIGFGPFVLDPAAGRLRRGTRVVPLRRKAWSVLCYLAARADSVVPNDDLLDAIWPGLHVTPQTLTNVIRELRVALRDRARTPRYIQTVHGQGHVFVGRTAAAAPPRTAAPDAAVLVGRDAELDRLQALWRHTRGGASRVAFVSGEPGIGKTTLVDAAVRVITATATRPAVRVARGVCLEHRGAGEAYLPLLAAIDDLLATPERRDVLARLRRVAPTWLAQLPWRVGPAERRRLEDALTKTTGPRMLREGVMLLRALTEVRPLVLVLEDLHWSDLPTLDLLAALARRPAPAALLVLGTFRPVDAAARPPSIVPLVRDLVRAGAAAECELGPFDGLTVRRYLDARFGTGALPSTLAGRLEEHSAGNPLFLRALVDRLVAGGRLARSARGWRVVESETAGLELPEGLRDFVTGEMDALSAPAQELAAAACVVGVTFGALEVAAALGRPAPSVEAGCDALARTSRLVRVDGETTGADGRLHRRYAFVHGAYRHLVYDGLGPIRRQTLHGALAAGLEHALGDRADLASLLATHFEAGAMPDKASEYYERAAANAERRFAYRECATYLRAALAQGAVAGPDPTGRAAVMNLRLAAMVALVDGYGATAVRDALDAARATFGAAHATRGVFMAEMGLTRHALVRADTAAAQEHADRLLVLSRSELPELAGPALLWAGFTASLLGELGKARALLEAGVAAPPAPGMTAHQDVYRMIVSQLALVLGGIGEVEAARARVDEALARSRAAARPADLAHACLQATELAIFVGDRPAARDAVREAATPATDAGLASFLTLTRFYTALLDDARSAAERLPVMRAALADRRRLGDRWHESLLLGLLAETELESGDVAAARASVDGALAHVAHANERDYHAELLRLRAECAVAEGCGAEAARSLDEALGVAQAQGAGLWEMRVRRSGERHGFALACGERAVEVRGAAREVRSPSARA